MRWRVSHSRRGRAALQSIVTNPNTGFQPLLAGAGMGAMWGNGTYFATASGYSDGTYTCELPNDGARHAAAKRPRVFLVRGGQDVHAHDRAPL